MNLDLIFNTIGTTGVVMILLGYFLITKGKLTGEHIAYHILNLVGASLLLVSLFYSWNLPSVIIEVCWIAISVYGLWKVTRKKA